MKKVREEELRCDVFAMYSTRVNHAPFFTDIQAITETVYLNDETHTAECVLDNAEYIETLEFFDRLKKEDLLTDIGLLHSDTFFIFQDSIPGGSTVYDYTQAADIDYFGNTVSAYPVFNRQTSVRSCAIATGICSASERKDKAFELLALTQTDPYLNNLLTFGLEGTDYNVDEKGVDTVINRVNLDRFSNHMICSRYENIFSAEEYTEIYNNAAVCEDTDFAFDAREVTEEIYATSMIMSEYRLPNTDVSLEDSISKLRSKLEDAGLQKIINECNRQYNEIYLKGKVKENEDN